MPKFGIEFVPTDAYWKVVYHAVQAEKAGYDYVWITDHFNNRNVYVLLTNIAIYTNKIKFGPGVTNPYMIHPIMTAQSMASLNEMAPGRVVCGLGTGDKTTLDMVGIERVKPLTAVKEAVQLIKEITTGKTVKFEGEVFKVAGARLNFKAITPIPIFIGAQGPKMLSLAAEIGDGVLINASNRKDFEDAMKYIKEGVEKAGKKLEDVEVVAATSFSASEDVKKAQKAATPVVAFIVAGSPELVLQRHNIPIESADKIREAIAKGMWKDVFSNVTPEMIEAFSISGTPDMCIEKLDQLAKIGVTLLITGSPIGPNVRDSINLIRKEIIPRLKK
ncbi:MAG: 5,10-methylenetetrahydromethanopterin reductase [archaeon]|nr:5,10-methylenetetrahydromethanopterin reductase [archaeon]MCP8316827.1 5,10-methylenetetrahydromethanopterin reductase [archaeon]MCP8319337.1 5,10-methylenetetrahydromethanopterin reductase [archaeon]